MASKFLFGCRVEVLESCKHMLDGLQIMFTILLLQGLALCVQCNLCVNVAEWVSTIARADGSSLVALLDVAGKGSHNSGHSLVIALVQVGRHSKISSVCLPFF